MRSRKYTGYLSYICSHEPSLHSMSAPFYNIRNYRPDDFEELVQSEAETEKLEQQYCIDSVQGLIENLGLPGHFPERNLFVAETNGAIVGYIDILPEVEIGRGVLSCRVHTRHRGNDLAKRLVECALRRARELGLKRVHVNIPQGNVTTERLFSQMGFLFVRRFLELRLNLSKVFLPDISKIDPQWRHLKRGEEDKLLQIQNRSFADTWGYNPNTIEEIIYRTSLSGFSTEDIIFAWAEDKVIGYCWTRRKFSRHKAVGGEKGRIYMLGVDPDQRGKEVGKQVLLAGLWYLKNKDIQIVELTVDSENNAALTLYRSVGFDICGTSSWYEKVLD